MPESSQRTEGLGPASPFRDVPIEVVVAVGRATPKLSDLLGMGPDDVLLLDCKVTDPVELFVGDRLIGRGHLEEADGDAPGALVVRLTEIVVTPEAT